MPNRHPHPLQGFMQTYLYPQALKEQQQHQHQQQAVALEVCPVEGLQEGGPISSSLQHLLQGACVPGPEQAAPKGTTPCRSLVSLETMSKETVLTSAASEAASAAASAGASPASRQGLGAAAEDWGHPAADPLFLTIFEACRSIAAAHLSPVVGPVPPVMASRGGRRNSMPVALFARPQSLLPDGPPLPKPASIAHVARPGNAVDESLIISLGATAAASNATGSNQGMRTTNIGSLGSLTTGRTAGQLTAAGVERTLSGMPSGSLWSALLTANNSQATSHAEAGPIQNLTSQEHSGWSMG